MFQRIVHKVRHSKQLVTYFFFTYADKIISFLLPLLILFGLRDRSLYTFVEVAFSYATLAMIVIDLGLSTYLFYGYRNAVDKPEFLEKAKTAFHQLLILYGIALVPVALLGTVLPHDQRALLLLIGIRSLFSLYVAFYSNIFRLEERPGRIYAVTISVNLVSLVLLGIASWLHLEHQIMYFFLPSAAFLLFVGLRHSLRFFKAENFRLLGQLLGSALTYAWPVILNVLAMSFINNYAKIYSYNRLSLEETTQVSYVMRIGLIIQLTHASFSSFFAKSLFMDERRVLNMRIFGRYNLVLWFSALLVAVIVIVSNAFFGHLIKVPLSRATFLFVFYIVVWCYIGFLELYFGVMNANRRVLYYSIIASLFYVIMLKLMANISVADLALVMVLSALLNLGLVMMGLVQLKVVSFKTRAPGEK